MAVVGAALAGSPVYSTGGQVVQVVSCDRETCGFAFHTIQTTLKILYLDERTLWSESATRLISLAMATVST